jgi:hypothetical protein
MISSSILLLANIGNPNSESAKILLSLSAADFVFCATCLICFIFGFYYGGFGMGLVGCYVTYVLVMGSSCVSIWTLGVAAMERYVSVVMGIVLTERQVYLWLSFPWFLAVLLTSLPFLMQTPMRTIQLEPHHWLCSVAWHDHSWQTLVQTSLCITCFSISFAMNIYCYTKVYIAFTEACKAKKKTQAILDSQRKVFIKCVALTCAFVLVWITYYIKMYVELLTGKRVDPIFASFAAFLGGIGPSLNSFVMCYFDNRLRGNVMEFLGIESKVSVAHRPAIAHQVTQTLATATFTQRS